MGKVSFNVIFKFNATNNHYIDYNIKGTSSSHRIYGQSVKGNHLNPFNTKIRMGAYSCE